MKQTVLSTLEKLPEEDLEKTYPMEVFGHPMTTGYFLIHVTGHVNYHLGQINITGGYCSRLFVFVVCAH